MPKLLFKLDAETETDIRSNEIAYILTIENIGTTTVELEALKARIPSDVSLSEIRNHTFKALKAKHADLVKQLTRLLNDFLITEREDVRLRQTETLKKMLRDALQFQGGFTALLVTVPMRILSGSMAQSLTTGRESLEAYSEKIEDFAQAERAYTLWIKDSDKAEVKFAKMLFDSKLPELKRLEEEMLADTASSSLATLEPETSFSQTYVFKFERNDWTPKKYNISVDGIYTETGTEPAGKNIRKYSASASVCPTITPSPKRLTILAIGSSLLGAVVKYVVEVSNNATIPESWELWLSSFRHPFAMHLYLNTIIGAIAALVFFNIYEYTGLGKNFNMGISWRSALLIGTLCGLFGDKIFEALKVFV